MDIEYEIFKGSRKSLIFRVLLDFDTLNSRVQYGVAGMGNRYYFGSNGMSFDVADHETSIIQQPTKRFYFGWDAGVGNVILRSFGQTLTANSVTLDVGGAAGFIYQFSHSIGLDLQVGYTYGYGFSNIAATTTTTRILFGGAFYF